MVEIFDTVVTFELFEQMFCCHLAQCKGICCVVGDAGAPLHNSEEQKIKQILPKILKYLPKKSIDIIESNGVAYNDMQGERVTMLVNNNECVFAYFENGIARCALERAYNECLTDFPKPISCHLYPVRVEKFANFTAVNFHRWEICNCAEIYGKTIKLPAYKFLKNPLIRRFGKEWYAELGNAAKAYYEHFKF
jgi:hypothetical protein